MTSTPTYTPTQTPTNTPTALPNTFNWGFDGRVLAMALSPDSRTLFIGGAFGHLGPRVGGSVLVDGTAGAQLNASAWPWINGYVTAAVADPSLPGAFYIIGTFTQVGSVSRNYAAHLLPDGSVDGWNPNPDYSVAALAIGAGKVFLSGHFTHINGSIARNYVAEVDPVDGTVTSWNPNPNDDVYALAVSGSTLYLGGRFSAINGSITRHNAAAVDVDTGIATAWNPNLGGTGGGTVNSLVVSGGTVYLGGWFTTAGGGLTRNRAAAVDTVNGTLTSWDPNLNGLVTCLTAGDGLIYLGGEFTTVNGSTPRTAAAAVDPSTAIATPWDPQINSSFAPYNVVTALTVNGSTVYIGGNYTTINGTLNRQGVTAVSATTGIATAWNPKVNGPVYAIAPSGSGIFLGGSFTGLTLADRANAAAISTSSGTLTSWNPSPNGAVSALAVDGGTVYLGGQFTSVGNTSRNNAAAVDSTDGAPTSWNPNISGGVRAMVIANSAVYLGGEFSTVNGSISRYGAASVDLTNGVVNAWNPNTTSPNPVNVAAIAVLGDTVYLGGGFSQVNGSTPRNGAAAVDATNGVVTAWNPNLSGGYVFSIAIAGSTIYLGGNFTSANGGLPRHFAVAVDGTAGNATPWNPNISESTGSTVYPGVSALAISGGTVFLGGDFRSLNASILRRNAAAVDTINGTANAWNPNPDSSVMALLPMGGTVWLGGAFSFPFYGLAPVDATNGAMIPSQLPLGP